MCRASYSAVESWCLCHTEWQIMATGGNKERDGFSGKWGSDLIFVPCSELRGRSTRARDIGWGEESIAEISREQMTLPSHTVISYLNIWGGSSFLAVAPSTWGRFVLLVTLKMTFLCRATSWLLLAQPTTWTPHKESFLPLAQGKDVSSPGVSAPLRMIWRWVWGKEKEPKESKEQECLKSPL